MRVLFSADPEFVGRTIRWFEKISWIKRGTVSHAAIRYGRDESNWMIEAAQYGFIPNWFSYFLKKRKVVIQYEVLGIDEDLLEKIVDEQVDKYIHKSYDYGNMLGFIFVIFWYKLTGQIKKNIFSWPKHFACSEVVYSIFNEVKKQTGIDYMGVHDSSTVFPEELMMECEKKPELFRLVTI